MKNYHFDMTTGKIWPVLLTFTLPLLLENLLQLLYNTVDSIVLGQYVGMSALAAVSATTHICGMLVRFFNGTAVGANVVISQSFGAKDKDKLLQSIQTTIILTLAACVLLTFLGVMCSKWLLKKISTPDDVFNEADLYLKIYFGGISGLLIYNVGGAILRAMGDSKRPLMFLIFCSVLNIILDLIFVINFRWGIAGAAVATIIAQMISALLVMYVIISSTGAFKKLCFEKKISFRILQIGLPVGIQMATVAFSNVFVQAYINYFGTACIAGWGIFVKMDQYMMLPIQSMGQAVTTFVGQNIGAGKIERTKQGTWTAFAMIAGISSFVALMLYFFAPNFSNLFSPVPEVINYGTMFIRLCSPIAVVCCFNQILSGALRGYGDSKNPMLITLFTHVIFRQIYLFFMSKFFPDNVRIVAFGYPAGWILCALLMSLYYFYYTNKFYKKNMLS